MIKLLNIYEALKSRKEMPQVESDSIKDAVKILRAADIECERESILPTDLKKSQKELVKAKVNRIVKELESGEKMPEVIISKDNHIVDGHHRVGGYLEYKPDRKIKVIRINLNKNDAIEAYKAVETLL